MTGDAGLLTRPGRRWHRDETGRRARSYHETTRPPGEIGADSRRALRSCEKLMEYISARDGDGAERFWATHMRAIRPYLIPGTDTKVVGLLY